MRQDPLQRGLRDLIGALEHSEEVLRSTEAFGSDAERAAGYAHLTRALLKGLQAEVLQDPDYPYFRIMDFWQREGGDPGMALVVRMPRAEVDYQAIQLADLWFASLEYGNQVSSLNGPQAVLAPDDAYHHVISAEDPGYPNWLDPGAFERGVFLLRYDGAQGPIPSDQHPSARVVTLSELSDAIPGFERVDAAERESVRRERRRHLQIRFGR